MKIKKRTAVTAVVALLVCIAVYLNWSYQQGITDDVGKDQEEIINDETRLMGQADLVNAGTVTQTSAEKKVAEYFAELRITRQQARDEAISVLETTTNDESISLEAREIAVVSITELASNSVIEAKIESLVLAKGYKDCAVFLNDKGLSIVVAPLKDGLKTEDAIKIKDIAVSETDVSLENIRIFEARIS